ncbi:MAG: NAD-dependent protein deacylase [Spirochaetaceae bacterium]|nr:NAD-dependent protein deacylase [Spirochaetaceae bacterium]
MDRLVNLLKESKYVIALTGAGISTLSGIKDFRGKDGLYKQRDADKIFDIDWFYRDPSLYYTAAKDFLYNMKDVSPSIVHLELARLEAKGIIKAVITQNIDVLHQKAGSKKVLELHGSLGKHRCTKCSATISFEEVAAIVNKDQVPNCSRCNGVFKPNVVFFGESLPVDVLSEAVKEASKADLLIVLGSTLVVNPAAMIPGYTRQNGGKVVIVNNMETYLDERAALRYEDLGEVFHYLSENI